MGHNAERFSRREMKKKGLINEEAFYEQLAQQCGYIDKETAKRFYLGLVKTVTAQLRANGVSRLPHMGDFALTWRAQTSALVGKTPDGVQKREIIPARQKLRFIPKEAWHQYFVRLHNRNG